MSVCYLLCHFSLKSRKVLRISLPTNPFSTIVSGVRTPHKPPWISTRSSTGSLPRIEISLPRLPGNTYEARSLVLTGIFLFWALGIYQGCCLNRLSTEMKQIKMDTSINSDCLFYIGDNMEDSNHLFLSWAFSQNIWKSILRLCCINRTVVSWD